MQIHLRPQPAPSPRTVASGVHAAIRKAKTAPPILASEVLREDLAPLEPGRRASKFWDGGVALVYFIVGVCLRFDLGVSGVNARASAICLAAAAATAVTAVAPFPYVWRAVVGGVVGAAVVLLGFAQMGPLAWLLDGSGPWIEAGRVVTCIAVPAALLFRSHYRAYNRGRILLGAAFALSTPFLVAEATLTAQGPAVARIGAALALTGTLSALLAFTAAPTTRVSAWCAEALTALLALELGLRQLYLPGAAGPLVYPLAAVAFFAAVVRMALGVFQTLACVYAREARMVDIHRPSQEPDAPSSD
jgi:hypothetical protein